MTTTTEMATTTEEKSKEKEGEKGLGRKSPQKTEEGGRVRRERVGGAKRWNLPNTVGTATVTEEATPTAVAASSAEDASEGPVAHSNTSDLEKAIREAGAMEGIRVLLVLSVALLTRNFAQGVTPLVLWHGMGDSCCNPLSLGRLMDLIKKDVPGIYIHSIKIGKDVVEDMLNGFFKNSNDQISEVCDMLADDANLANGFNAMGFSQGGQFLRALVQRCDKVKVRNLISVGGQHQGVFGFPRCPGDNSTTCDEVRRLLNIGVYNSFVQSFLVQAEYWQDPLNEAEYAEKCVFLPDINQVNRMNPDYKTRLSAIQKLVLVKFELDTMVQPKESEWFGFYKSGQDKDVYSLYESDIWTKDLLGLQHLNSTGNLLFLSAPFDHLQFTDQWFIDNLLPFVKN
ncbi:Palmitoyl-protein thioesterase 1 [Geodia barretti]|uniref:Palmitoyl-protein thioesterase 1 n=1 Tax=Geodia barretti TaxID=519541 RepID=A0AA35XDW7_GEOBA|nr:Palmitoyl-protein thioesterase 1 [Geodia barretti]